MAMDQFLAEYYGTTSAQEDYTKQASVELFLKLASEEGVDLNSLPDAQVQDLYNSWVKAAAEGHEDAKEEARREAVVEEAKKEHETKKKEQTEKAEKVAEADFLGRVMAHSYVQEMRKIALSTTDEGHKLDTEMANAAAEGHGRAAKALSEYRKEAPIRSYMLHGLLQEPLHKLVARNAEYRAKTHAEGKNPVNPFGGLLTPGRHEKQGSALDELAAERAVYTAYQSGFDANEAAQKVAAVLTLGPGESVKVASAPDVDTAVSIRSLELLELAGYPVQWNQ